MRVSGLIGGVLAAASLSQFPEFTQQYEQRLGGAVDQLQIIVADFDASAARAGLSRDEALATYDSVESGFLVDRGRDMRMVFARFDKLSSHLAELQNAGPLDKVTGFARYYDQEVGTRALETYQPAVPVTPESFGWAGAGLLGGYGLIAGLMAGVRRLRGPGRPRITRG